MPIAIFSNDNQESLFLIIEPDGDRYEIPHMAKGGIRYILENGAEDRSFSAVSRNEIRFWCHAASHEVEVVRPSSFDLLLWDICVNGGFCGGVRGNQPLHVTDLLPLDGMVSAERFAELAIEAEGGGADPEPMRRAWGERLAGQFVKHMGAQVMPAEALQMNLRLPFEPPEG